MKKFAITFPFFFFSFVCAMSQEPVSVKLFSDPKQSSITYAVEHPLHAWTGVSQTGASVITTDKEKKLIDKVAVSVKVSSFDSQNANRDSHVIEATEAMLYPMVTFTGTVVSQEANNLKISGILKFHGVSQAIQFDAVKSCSGNTIIVTGTFDIKMTSFNIDPPSLMGLPTSDNIRITFNMVYR